MTETPMMKQYNEIKQRHLDSILFFRLGDFYEMFNEDAKIASKALEITLTCRNKKSENPVPLCGIPYHAAESYIGKLIKKGYKVAICEQTEDPKQAKGIVKRDVIRVVTPGTSMNIHNFEEKDNNFLAGILPHSKGYGFALLDLSTGEFRMQEFLGKDSETSLLNELTRTEPKELLLPQTVYDKNNVGRFVENLSSTVLSPYEDWAFEFDFSHKLLLEHFGVMSLDGFGCAGLPVGISAAGAVLHYIQETQKTTLNHINSISVHKTDEHMNLDSSSIRSMELLKRNNDGVKDGSLFGLLDLTSTAMGGRCLKKWITMPLLNVNKIVERHEVVEKLKNDIITRKDLRGLLANVYDMERIISKVTLQLCNARDLLSLKNSLEVLPNIEKTIKNLSAQYSEAMLPKWDNISDLYTILDSGINEDPPLTLRDGRLIQEGYNSELDDLKIIAKEGRGWISDLEAKERERTGIQSLKVRYNNVYGYYIEVTKKNADNVPEDYIRKQSLVNAERFISQDLKELETKVLTAEDRMKELEYQLFDEIRKKVAKETIRIQKMAAFLSEIDIFASFAEVADRHNFIKPSMSDNGELFIKEGRHPVIEKLNQDERFIPNDTLLDCDKNQISIITGPNMAGKSTYLRQVALIVLMAQIGSFVPASEASIGVADRIFTRVGAQDDLVKGQSTFMVEMNETANIMNNATKKSLIILDEIGRGTSTFDGISIAWSIAEYLKETVGARTLFATHYFELTELSSLHEGINNYNIAIKEWNDKIIFLRKIQKGSADKSYGIQVARLAGLPEKALLRAKQILANLEEDEVKGGVVKNETRVREKDSPDNKYKQLDLFSDKSYDSIIYEIKDLSIENLTPLQALNKLYEIKEKVRRL